MVKKQLIKKDDEYHLNAPRLNWKIRIGGMIILTAVTTMIIYTFITSDISWLQTILFLFGTYYLIITIASLFNTDKPQVTDYKPFVSILIPAHNEEHAIAKCVESMCSIDYQKKSQKNFEIIVIDDGSTDQTPRILKNLKKTLNFKILRRDPPLAGNGKGAALNDGLKMCKGECILVFDADSQVKKDFLSIMTPYLADPQVVGAQAKVRMKNATVNSLTSLQDDEFATFNRIIQKGRTIINGATALGGNGQMVKKEALESVGGWWDQSITEDLDLSIRVMLNHGIVKYCDQAIVYQEAVTSLKDLLKQRIRWAEGHLESMITYSWKVLTTQGLPLTRRIDFLFYLVGVNIVFLIVLSYILGFIQLFVTMGFKSNIPATLWIFSSLVFFPTIITGLYLEVDKRPHIILYRTLRFWLYCLHWIPVFFAAISHIVTAKTEGWMKTTHRGANIILGSHKKLTLPKIKNPLIISSEDKKSVLSLKIKADPQNMKKTKLLIVEDEFIFAKNLKMTIENMGYNVIGIENSGEQAIKKIAETKPDLILMDIMLNGEIDGIDATYQIWERFKIPVLYITAHSDQATMVRIKESPNAGILIKPILSDDLQHTIETTISIAAGE